MGDDENCSVVKAKLNNGIDGFINTKNCEESLFSQLEENTIVNAKIERI